MGGIRSAMKGGGIKGGHGGTESGRRENDFGGHEWRECVCGAQGEEGQGRERVWEGMRDWRREKSQLPEVLSPEFPTIGILVLVTALYRNFIYMLTLAVDY